MLCNLRAVACSLALQDTGCVKYRQDVERLQERLSTLGHSQHSCKMLN